MSIVCSISSCVGDDSCLARMRLRATLLLSLQSLGLGNLKRPWKSYITRMFVRMATDSGKSVYVFTTLK